MARTKRSAKLDSRTARLKLPSEERHQEPLAPGRYLVYRRPKSEAAGSWSAYWYDSASRQKAMERLGTADDFADANGLTVMNYTQAQAKAQEWFDHRDHIAAHGEDAPKAGPFTVDAALDLYFADGERRGMKGISQDKQRAKKWIRPELGPMGVEVLTRSRIEAWMTKMAESPRGVRGKGPVDPSRHVPIPRVFKNPRPQKAQPEPRQGPQTADEKRARKDSANRVLTVLKAALNHALDRRKVRGGEAWQTVKPYRGVGSSRLRFLTDQEQVVLVNACPSDFRKLVQGALLTGARYGELTRLQVKDFNPTARTVFLEVTKNGKSRYVHLTDEGVALFAALTAGRAGDELVFQRDQVTRTKREGLGNAWGSTEQVALMAAAWQAAKIAKVTFHELRHTYASMLLNRGVPMHMVAAQIGDGIRMVEKHYGHLSASTLAETLRGIQGLGLVEAPRVAALKVAALQ